MRARTPDEKNQTSTETTVTHATASAQRGDVMERFSEVNLIVGPGLATDME